MFGCCVGKLCGEMLVDGCSWEDGVERGFEFESAVFWLRVESAGLGVGDGFAELEVGSGVGEFEGEVEGVGEELGSVEGEGDVDGLGLVEGSGVFVGEGVGVGVGAMGASGSGASRMGR